MAKEAFKAIKGYSDYHVSNYGYVVSFKMSQVRILKQGISHNGYCLQGLTKKGKTKTFRLSRLVAEAFVKGKSKSKNQVNHKDGNKLNNHYSNLEWCSSKENINHAWKNSLAKKHRNHAKLKWRDVEKIKNLKGKLTQKKIADMFNVSRDAIGKIHRGERGTEPFNSK